MNNNDSVASIKLFDENQKHQEIFKVFPAYHTLGKEKKIEMLNLLIGWAKEQLELVKSNTLKRKGK